MNELARYAAETKWTSDHPGSARPSRVDLDAYQASPLIQATLLCDRFHLMPNAWCAGLLRTDGSTRSRDGYLLGEISTTGWWYYFPLAMLFKTPTATLLAFLLAAAAVASRRIKLGIGRWGAACLATPVLIYGYSLLTSHLNLGLRHALPVYPFAFIAAAVAWAAIARARPRLGDVVDLPLAACKTPARRPVGLSQ